MSEFVIRKELFISHNQGNIKDTYDISDKPLGEGAFGVVYLGTEKETGLNRAVKAIERSKIKNFQRFYNEVNALKTLDHPHIIKLFEVYEDETFVYLVQELWEGGELFDFIVEQEFLTEDIAATVFHQIMQSIMYWHKNRIAHRDLKPENFMLKSKGGEICVKLIDFGLSCSFMVYGATGKEKLKRMTTKAGTLFFMAPEVLTMNYSSKWDVWSAGVILYIMLWGYPPFASEDDDETMQLIEQGEVEFDDDAWGEISDEAKDLIVQIFQVEQNRLSAKKVLSHPWVQKHVNSAGAVEPVILDAQMKRLKEYQNKSKFRKAILSYLSTRVNDDDVKEEKKLFEQLDKNKDGYITIKELQEADKSNSGIDLKNILMSIDMDKNGAINYSEFIAATMNDMITKDMKKVQAAFKFFDKDDNGTIEADDLKKLLETENDIAIDETVIDDIVKEWDYDGDGKIDYKEFYRAMSIRNAK